jgi:hypothetical protein
MNGRNKVLARAPELHASLTELLGPPPLVFDENPEHYDRLMVEFAKALAPKDFLDWVLIKDSVDSTYQVSRCRRSMSAIMNNHRAEAIATQIAVIKRVLDPENDPRPSARRMAYAYVAGEPEAVAEVSGLFAEYKIDERSIVGLVFGRNLETIREISQMADEAQIARERTLHEYERRTRQGSRLREVVDADFEELDRVPESEGETSVQPAVKDTSEQDERA